MAKKVSLKDIAEKVGVSTALVSYVLNGKEKEKRVGAELVKKIKKVANDLNYTPNQIARSLRKGNTKTLGLIVADIANPFFGTMARVVEDEANRFGYTLVIGSSDEDSNKLGKLIDTLCNRQVDGFIIVPPEGSDSHIEELLKRDVPLVLTDRYFEWLDTNYVVLDNYAATNEATTYLINKGYRRIGIVAQDSELIHMSERVRGYSEAMKGNGLEKELCIEELKFSELKFKMLEIVMGLTSGDSPLEALIFATNSLSLGGLYSIKKTGLRVPNDLAIIGFDGNEAFDFFYAPLTYISQPIAEMAKESVRILIDQIEEENNKTENIKLKHSLIIQDSC